MSANDFTQTERFTMTDRKKENPENTRERNRRMREKLKDLGLIQTSVYVPETEKQALWDFAKTLRIKAGMLMPTDNEG